MRNAMLFLCAYLPPGRAASAEPGRGGRPLGSWRVVRLAALRWAYRSLSSWLVNSVAPDSRRLALGFADAVQTREWGVRGISKTSGGILGRGAVQACWGSRTVVTRIE